MSHNPPLARPNPSFRIERIASRIYLIRGEKVMLDNDLADFYQIKTKNLNKTVECNFKRF